MVQPCQKQDSTAQPGAHEAPGVQMFQAPGLRSCRSWGRASSMETQWEVAPFYCVPKMGVAPNKGGCWARLDIARVWETLRNCFVGFLLNYCFIFVRVASIPYLAAYSGISTWLHDVRFIYLKSSSQISGLFTNLGCFLANPFGAQNSKASHPLHLPETPAVQATWNRTNSFLP